MIFEEQHSRANEGNSLLNFHSDGKRFAGRAASREWKKRTLSGALLLSYFKILKRRNNKSLMLRASLKPSTLMPVINFHYSSFSPPRPALSFLFHAAFFGARFSPVPMRRCSEGRKFDRIFRAALNHLLSKYDEI